MFEPDFTGIHTITVEAFEQKLSASNEAINVSRRHPMRTMNVGGPIRSILQWISELHLPVELYEMTGVCERCVCDGVD